MDLDNIDLAAESQQAAEMLGMSERTGRRTWAYARAWLTREINGQNHGQ